MSGLCVSSVRWLRSVTAQDAHRIPCTGHANVDMCGLQQEPTDWGSKEKASQKLVAPGSAASKGTTSPITTRHSPLEHRPEQRSDSPYAPAVKTKLTPQLATPLSQPLVRRPQPEHALSAQARAAARAALRPTYRSQNILQRTAKEQRSRCTEVDHRLTETLPVAVKKKRSVCGLTNLSRSAQVTCVQTVPPSHHARSTPRSF